MVGMRTSRKKRGIWYSFHTIDAASRVRPWSCGKCHTFWGSDGRCWSVILSIHIHGNGGKGQGGGLGPSRHGEGNENGTGRACRRLWSKCLAALYQPLGSLLAGQSPGLGD